MYTWILNLSQSDFMKYIVKIEFVNNIMLYQLTAFALADNRFQVFIKMDVFGIIPTVLAIKKLTGYDVAMSNNAVGSNHRLNLKLGDAVYVSHYWRPNIADHCLSSVDDSRATLSLHEYLSYLIDAAVIPDSDLPILLTYLKGDTKKQIDVSEEHQDILTLPTVGLMMIINTYTGRMRSRIVERVRRSHRKEFLKLPEHNLI